MTCLKSHVCGLYHLKHTVHLDCSESCKCQCGHERKDHAPEADIGESQGQEVWTVDTHTIAVATDAFGEVQFESACSAAPASKVKYTESQKRCHRNHGYNFVNSSLICKIFPAAKSTKIPTKPTTP